MDPKLRLKPIELLDIGVDKLTKIPVPILSSNINPTFAMENELPNDTFILTFDSNYSDAILSFTFFTDYQIYLTFNFGDGFIENWIIPSGYTSMLHVYTGATTTYNVTVNGWLDRIKTLIILPSGTTEGGVTTADITQMKKLSYVDLSNNRLTSLSLSGMIYLNTIKLDNNYFTNDIIDDLYIDADTFLTFNGSMSTTGINNGVPSIYSDIARNSLTVYKQWTLNYNT